MKFIVERRIISAAVDSARCRKRRRHTTMGEHDDDEIEDVAPAQTGAAAEASKGLDRLGGRDDDGDDAAAADVATPGARAEALRSLLEEGKAEKEAEAARLRELAKVKIDAADVAVIVSEMEVEKKAAELRLREHGGDLAAALRSYVAV